MAASVVYRSAIKHSPTEQDPNPLRAVQFVIAALRGEESDKSAFHRKRREIRDRAPKLIQEILEAWAKAKTMPIQDARVLPLIDEDCFPSLKDKGGLFLVSNLVHV